jgi:hypothetical protein
MASIAQHFIALPCGIMFMLKTTHQNQNPFTNKKAKETGHPYDVIRDYKTEPIKHS